MSSRLTVNGREYAWPRCPTVVICVDGCAPDYLDQAIAAGHMPFFATMRRRGLDLAAECVVPSFTNPNNLSIVTGVPPAIHGICGNYLIDPDSGEAVMMNDPRFLRCGTLLAAFAEAGARVAVVTAKDKLRALLGHGLPLAEGRCVCFSAEKSDRATLAEHGIAGVTDLVGMATPSVYSAELSEFVFAAGVRLLETAPFDLIYLSTTDYIQHKHAPGSAAANGFYGMMDRYLARLDRLGATIALTADHGMSAKHDAEGRPNVVYLQDLADGLLGPGRARVILPITDPYVVHHGALGGFAVIYLASAADGPALAERLAATPGIAEILPRDEACARFALPPDREGDLIVIAAPAWTLGASPDQHDLSQLREPLRSHGGTSEQRVPLVVNRKGEVSPSHRPRNFDAFALALNGTL